MATASMLAVAAANSNSSFESTEYNCDYERIDDNASSESEYEPSGNQIDDDDKCTRTCTVCGSQFSSISVGKSRPDFEVPNKNAEGIEIETRQSRSGEITLPQKLKPFITPHKGFRGYVPTLAQRKAVPGGDRRFTRRKRDLHIFILRREFYKKFLRYKAQKEKYLRLERLRKLILFIRQFIRVLILMITLNLMFGIFSEILEFVWKIHTIILRIARTNRVLRSLVLLDGN